MPDCRLDPRLGGKNSTKVTNEAKAKARVLETLRINMF